MDPLSDEKKYTLDDIGSGVLFADAYIDKARLDRLHLTGQKK